MILELLLVIAAAEMAVVVVLIFAVAVNASLLWWRERRSGRIIILCRQIVYEYIFDPLRPLTGEERKLLDRLTWIEQVDLLAALARSLSRDERPVVFELARILGVIDKAKRLTMSWWWNRRLRGVRVLMLLSDDRSEIPRLVADPNHEVRSESVEWAADEPSVAMAELIAPLLDHAAPRYRFAVMDALIRLRGVAVEPLSKVLRTSTKPTTLTFALRVARHIGDARIRPEVLSLLDSADDEVVSEAALVLGSIGGSESPGMLRRLLGHASPDVRTAAIAALRKLDDHDAVEEIAARLRDVSWNVRREAALTLRSLGPDGMILLQQMTLSEDRFAADMARQVLSIPEGALS